MHYKFIVVSTIVLAAVGYFVTVKIIKPRLENESYIIPEDMEDFVVSEDENKALKWAGLGLIIALLIIVLLAYGPLAPYTDENGP